ncbi:hypothetical protein CDL15_Pgr016560 [Punica granatum]|uniref:Uncharacterized protein n=1 Tax=Punica granatum TaxID=22663 RepID=A0A218WK88_PUNGR|nr:hypothetical protein CDL15_Pgr016560 [Punica granatum]
MLGQNPKVVIAGPRHESSKCRTEARCGAEAQKWGQSPMRGRNPNVSPKLDAENTGPEPDARPKPNAVNACSIRKCKRCKSKDRGWSTREGRHNSPVMRGGWSGWTASGHITSRRGEVKTVGGLPAKVGTTRLSCETG